MWICTKYKEIFLGHKRIQPMSRPFAPSAFQRYSKLCINRQGSFFSQIACKFACQYAWIVLLCSTANQACNGVSICYRSIHRSFSKLTQAIFCVICTLYNYITFNADWPFAKLLCHRFILVYNIFRELKKIWNFQQYPMG